jgi:DNA invertase Pin-like site-specific DNA recombinase
MKSIKVKKIELIETDVFGYSRKSPDDKESTEVSMHNQDELINNTCLGKGWNLMGIEYDKNISGGDRDREGIKNVISKAKKHKVANPKKNVHIITKDQDRFARDYAFMGDTLKDLEAYGVKVFSIMKNDFLSSDDLGDTIMSVMNEQMIKEGRKKAILTRDKKINDKLPCIPAPFGYKYFKKNWVIVPKEAEIVKQVISDYLKNINYRETLTHFKIDKGVYYRIISNAKKGLYNGIIKFENKIKDSKKTIIRTEVIEYPGTYEHILNKETYTKLNEPQN